MLWKYGNKNNRHSEIQTTEIQLAEIQITEIQKYKLNKYRNANYRNTNRNTNLRNRKLPIAEKHTLQNYINAIYRSAEIQITGLQKSYTGGDRQTGTQTDRKTDTHINRWERSKVSKRYLKVQGIQEVPRDPRYPKGT